MKAHDSRSKFVVREPHCQSLPFPEVDADIVCTELQELRITSKASGVSVIVSPLCRDFCEFSRDLHFTKCDSKNIEYFIGFSFFNTS